MVETVREGLRMPAGRAVSTQLVVRDLAVPNDLVPRRGNSYVLRVRGESMIDEHIQDGDYVVVHGRSTADDGEMVIALVNGTSATVKRLYREPGGWVRLQPSNDRMRPIRAHGDDVLIQGIVVGVIRKF